MPAVGNVNESLRMDKPLPRKVPVPTPMAPAQVRPSELTQTPAEDSTFGRDAAATRGKSLTLRKMNRNSTGDQGLIGGRSVSPEEKKIRTGRRPSLIAPPSDGDGGGG